MSGTYVRDRAWEIHRANGHPKGYEGPCWGPLPEEVEQAKRELLRGSSSLAVPSEGQP